MTTPPFSSDIGVIFQNTGRAAPKGGPFALCPGAVQLFVGDQVVNIHGYSAGGVPDKRDAAVLRNLHQPPVQDHKVLVSAVIDGDKGAFAPHLVEVLVGLPVVGELGKVQDVVDRGLLDVVPQQLSHWFLSCGGHAGSGATHSNVTTIRPFSVNVFQPPESVCQIQQLNFPPSGSLRVPAMESLYLSNVALVPMCFFSE